VWLVTSADGAAFAILRPEPAMTRTMHHVICRTPLPDRAQA
jgi:hypothetical protein